MLHDKHFISYCIDLKFWIFIVYGMWQPADSNPITISKILKTATTGLLSVQESLRMSSELKCDLRMSK